MRRIGGRARLGLLTLRLRAGTGYLQRRMTLRRARILVLPLAIVGILLPAAPASSSLAIVGFTWYSDGTFGKSGSASTLIVAYANGAKANTAYKLQATEIRGGFACSDVLPVDVNPNVRMSNNAGIIGYTAGVVNKPPGNYELCFYEQPRLPSGHSPTATAPAFFTVL